MSELSDTQRQDLKAFAESINGSEASYGAIILRLMEENEKLRSTQYVSPDSLRMSERILRETSDQADKLAAENSELRVTARERLTSMEELSNAVTQLRREKDNAYSERDMLVCAFAKLAVVLGWEAWIGRHEVDFEAELRPHHAVVSEWDAEWRTVIYVQTPHGQVSWHVHDSEVAWFDFLPRCETPGWDGHTTVEKYARLASISVDALRDGLRSFLAQAQMDAAEEAQESLRELHDDLIDTLKHDTQESLLRRVEQLERVATEFARKQRELAPGDFASIEFETLEHALGLREITPDAVMQERLHQEIDRFSADDSRSSETEG